jgi:hypothetical protein
VDVREVKADERAEQRFGGDEANRRRHLAQVVGTADPPLVLDRDAHPDVRRPLEPRRDLDEVFVSLGQDLEGVLARLGHHREDLLDELERDLRVEKVAHRVDEDHSRPPPAQRLLEPVRP